MSTDTTLPPQEEIAAWTPPEVQQGDFVEFTRTGSFTDTTHRLAEVSSVDGRSLNLRLSGGAVFTGVLHHEDPTLIEFPHQREDNGVWRESPAVRRLNKIEGLLDNLVPRVRALEKAIATPSEKPNKSGNSNRGTR